MKTLIRSALLLLATTAPLAFAQATWYVQTVIPEVISVRTPTTSIGFELSLENYPPPQFPARYAATSLEDGVLPVQVFVNEPGVWSLLLEIPDLLDESGNRLIPAEQILFRVDGGPWLRGSNGPQEFYTDVGATDGWKELRLEFALELKGHEPPGEYAVNVVVSAIREP
ncbi:MAG TPA: hypothetical protein ENK37_03000 [Oceanithermus profundus]|uniref:Uncharacterized protein n=1 Tax=Oceanithermus profundus TaxID=187137 RepID=A0A7C4V5H1_9DEIN|nr:hypothetical protein [Oceanithermus profundus]